MEMSEARLDWMERSDCMYWRGRVRVARIDGRNKGAEKKAKRGQM